jgi:hypothetical protein
MAMDSGKVRQVALPRLKAHLDPKTYELIATKAQFSVPQPNRLVVAMPNEIRAILSSDSTDLFHKALGEAGLGTYSLELRGIVDYHPKGAGIGRNPEPEPWPDDLLGPE